MQKLENTPAALTLPSPDRENFVYHFAGKALPVTNFGKVNWQQPTHIIQYLHIDSLIPDPDNGRTTVTRSELNDLTESIKQDGIHNPLKVRPDANGEAIIIGGHKRLAGARGAQL